MRTRRRLPVHVRRLVTRLEREFACDDDHFEVTLTQLSDLHQTLSDQQRSQLDTLLTAAGERAEHEVYLLRVRRALAHGTHKSIAVLPGGVELVEVVGGGFEQLLLTVPAPLPDDDDATRALVSQARSAVLKGLCPSCRATLQGGAGEQMELTHRSSCALSGKSLARARRQATSRSHAAK